MNDEIIKLLLKSKSLDEFSEKYVEQDNEDKTIYNKNGGIDAELSLSAIMSHQINLNILAKIIWDMKPKYVRIEKFKRLIN